MGNRELGINRAAHRRGHKLRRDVARMAHARWDPSKRTHDPIDLLLETEADRLPRLIPDRRKAMAKSAYAYLRGSAASMAADVATGPLTGICVQASGDCHLNNFGFFASPERRLLFDITDFDETAFAGWEFDLKRLVVSVVLKGRVSAAASSVSEHSPWTPPGPTWRGFTKRLRRRPWRRGTRRTTKTPS